MPGKTQRPSDIAVGTTVLCRHDMARDPWYTDAGQLMRAAFNGQVGVVNSINGDGEHPCYGILFTEWKMGHFRCFFDREELMTHVHTAADSRIFVFGSNRLGVHGAGAARYANRDLGFPMGIGEGLGVRAYALPTCSEPGVPLRLDEVRAAVANFITVARLTERLDPAARFFVSEVGCGLAGFTTEQVAPMFTEAPPNCDLPPSWRRTASE